MRRTSNSPIACVAWISICVLFGSLTAGCVKKPWRSYEKQPFDSAGWRNGDAVTRGTMYSDLGTTHALEGKSRDEVLEMLGEPDKKRPNAKGEAWLYRVEVVGRRIRSYVPVSFDGDGRASFGEVSGGKAYALVDE